MEILAEHTDLFEQVVMLTLVGAVAIGLSIFVIAIIAQMLRDKDADGIFYLVVIAFMAFAFAVLFIIGLKAGPITYYDVIVTDWNAVYDAGYTVESIDGKIVTLTKD